MCLPCTCITHCVVYNRHFSVLLEGTFCTKPVEWFISTHLICLLRENLLYTCGDFCFVASVYRRFTMFQRLTFSQFIFQYLSAIELLFGELSKYTSNINAYLFSLNFVDAPQTGVIMAHDTGEWVVSGNILLFASHTCVIRVINTSLKLDYLVAKLLSFWNVQFWIF